jgi:hypothetical protein
MKKIKPYSDLYKSAPNELRKWAKEMRDMKKRMDLLERGAEILMRESTVMAIRYGPGRYA